MLDRFFFGDDEDDWDDEAWEGDEDDFEDLPEDLDFFNLLQQAEETEEEQLVYTLEQFTVKELRQIAGRRGWRLVGVAKGELVRQMAAYLLAARQDPMMLAGLSENGRTLLAAAHTLFNINAIIYQHQWEFIWRTIFKRKEPVAALLKEFESYGLFYLCREHGDDPHHHPILALPEAILPSYAIIPRSKTTISPLKRSLPAARPFLETIEQIIHYLAAGGPMRLTPQPGDLKPEGHASPWVGNWPHLPEEVNKLPAYNPYLAFYNRQTLTVPLRRQVVDIESCQPLVTAVGDPRALDWCITFLLPLQVVTVDETLNLGFSAENWNMLVSLPRQQLLVALYQTWGVNIGDVTELRLALSRLPDSAVWRAAHPEIPYQTLLSELVLGRQTLLRLLRALAENPKRRDEWISLADFKRELFALRPTLYHNILSPGEWGFQQKNKLLNLEKEGDWLKTLGEVVQATICGPLYWMNMVELRGSQADPVAFQLTEMGRFLLSPSTQTETAVPQSTSPGEAIWLDGRTVQISPGYDMAGLLALMTQLGTAVPRQPFTYRLDGAGLESAFAAGESPDTLERLFLESGWRLPESGREYLDETYERFGLAHLYDDLTVVEFSDDTALAELRAAGLLDNCLVHEFSHRLIAIRPETADQLLARLEGRGYTPRRAEGIEP
jgi:hypothetical protein